MPRTPHRPPRPWVPQAAKLRVFAQLHTTPPPLPPLLPLPPRLPPAPPLLQ